MSMGQDMLDASLEAARAGRPWFRSGFGSAQSVPSPAQLEEIKAAKQLALIEYDISQARETLLREMSSAQDHKKITVSIPLGPAETALRADLEKAGWDVTDYICEVSHNGKDCREPFWRLTPKWLPPVAPLPTPKPGEIFLHRKTKAVYMVFSLAKHTETGEIAVIYDRACASERANMPHSRPLTMFTDRLADGLPRFLPLGCSYESLASEIVEHATKSANDALAGVLLDPEKAWDRYLADSPRMRSAMGISP